MWLSVHACKTFTEKHFDGLTYILEDEVHDAVVQHYCHINCQQQLHGLHNYSLQFHSCASCNGKQGARQDEFVSMLQGFKQSSILYSIV